MDFKWIKLDSAPSFSFQGSLQRLLSLSHFIPFKQLELSLLCQGREFKFSVAYCIFCYVLKEELLMLTEAVELSCSRDIWRNDAVAREAAS